MQEFISQARSTRDLWSGSYLLSWLVAHAIKTITGGIGPDTILFPALCGQPLFDFLNKQRYEKLGWWKHERGGKNRPLHHDNQILTPNLPNRFLALVPEASGKELAERAENAAREELRKIGCHCWEWLCEKQGAPGETAKSQWDSQIKQFLTIQWQLYPWTDRDPKAAIERLAELPAGRDVADGAECGPAEALQRAWDASIRGIPDRIKDTRNYCEGDLRSIDNPGFAWAAHYAETEFLLAARRNVRDFNPWGEWKNGKPVDLEVVRVRQADYLVRLPHLQAAFRFPAPKP